MAWTGPVLVMYGAKLELMNWYSHLEPGNSSTGRWTFLAEPITSRTQVSPAGTPICLSLGHLEARNPGRVEWSHQQKRPLGSFPLQLSHDDLVIGALLPGTPTPHSCPGTASCCSIYPVLDEAPPGDGVCVDAVVSFFPWLGFGVAGARRNLRRK